MKLHILIQNNGDGSSSPRFVLDPDVLQACQDNFEDAEMHPGVDGDGFHYTSIEVPDGSTAQSLGLSEYSIITKEYLEENYQITVE